MKKALLVGGVIALALLLFFAGGFAEVNDGSTKGTGLGNAIIVPEYDEDSGIAWEYDWLAGNACPNNGGPREVEMQELVTEGESYYDVLHVRCADGSMQSYYFDITGFFGNWE